MANGNHVHFSIWYVYDTGPFCQCAKYEVDWQGLHGGYGGWQEQIGDYIWTDDGDQYLGCAVQVYTQSQTCSNGNLTTTIYNDGAIAGPAAQLAIVSAPIAGSFSSSLSASLGPITIMFESSAGTPLQAPSGGLTVNLNSTSSSFAFANSSGGSHVTSVTIAAGSSQATVYYGDSVVGTPTISASASNLTSAIQVESVGPIVSGIQPQQGPPSGGTTVTISGSGFNSSSVALFGSKQATSTTYVSSSQLQAVSPSALADVTDVMVVTNGAQSITTPADRFVYGSIPNYRGMSTQQYTLSNSNGSTWSVVDQSKLTLTVVPAVTSYAVLSATASLFTNTANVNQDLGITVSPSPSGCAQSPVVWKESGGALAWRPNPVSMEVACTFSQGTTYTVQLVWKSNSPTGATIYAGAGSGPYSQTTISASLTPASGSLVQAKTSTSQYHTSSASWTPVDSSNLSSSITFASAVTARLSADADLIAVPAGVNADLGICVVTGSSLPNPCPGSNVAAWEEAGGSSSFQPIASAVQTDYSFSAGTYTLGLVWRLGGPSGTIYAGAGPSSGQYSTTVLLINTATNPVQASVTTQPTRQSNSPNNGTSWQDMDSNLILTLTPTQDSLVYLSGNGDLFTNSTSFNADLGICIYTAPAAACDPGGSSIAAWTESGTGANYNPDANLVQIPVPVLAGKTYTVHLQWRTNAAMPSGTYIWSGAGSGSFSSTSLSAWLVPLSTCTST